MIIALITYLFLLPALVFSNFQGAQTKATDAESISDINSLFTSLEIYHNENGFYPERDLRSNLQGLDAEAFTDTNGREINESGSDYSYTPSGCAENNGKCTSFVLSAKLVDGTMHEKRSLND